MKDSLAFLQILFCCGALCADNRFVSNDGTWRMKNADGVEMEGTCYSSLTNALKAPNGCVIYVKNDYDCSRDTIPMNMDGSTNARYAIGGGITSCVIRSESGDWRTGPTLAGAPDPTTETGCGANAFRALAKSAYGSMGIEVVGFRLTGGCSPKTIGSASDLARGGGVCAGSGAADRLTLRSCLVSGGTSALGGGAYMCTLVDCVVSNNLSTASGGGCAESVLVGTTVCGNRTTWNSSYGGGGGLYLGRATNCVIEGNETADNAHGGGAWKASLSSCVVRGNSSGRYGGGTSEGLTVNCVVTGNVQRLNGAVGAGGGGAYGGTHFNALIAFNTANNQGGGTYEGAFFNCTVYANTNTLAKGTYSGGVSSAALVNSISWGNVGADDAVTAATNSCLQVAAVTDAKYVDCVNVSPKFGSALVPKGACRDSGRLFDWMTDPADPRAVDLLGHPRVTGDAPDMGCYEALPIGLLLLFR